jgi:hypothetical protein
MERGDGEAHLDARDDDDAAAAASSQGPGKSAKPEGAGGDVEAGDKAVSMMDGIRQDEMEGQLNAELDLQHEDSQGREPSNNPREEQGSGGGGDTSGDVGQEAEAAATVANDTRNMMEEQGSGEGRGGIGGGEGGGQEGRVAAGAGHVMEEKAGSKGEDAGGDREHATESIVEGEAAIEAVAVSATPPCSTEEPHAETERGALGEDRGESSMVRVYGEAGSAGDDGGAVAMRDGNGHGMTADLKPGDNGRGGGVTAGNGEDMPTWNEGAVKIDPVQESEQSREHTIPFLIQINHLIPFTS